MSAFKGEADMVIAPQNIWSDLGSHYVLGK
jgi:hypothetical protein